MTTANHPRRPSLPSILRWTVWLLLAIAAHALAPPPAMSSVMTWPDLLERPRPEPDARVAYGGDPLQHVDLWRPAGAGACPVVLMVHGGCWQTGVATAPIMNWIAADLRGRGTAVWNVEYRGVDRAGGGYPGTFLDVAAAADRLRTDAARYRLETGRVVAFGHSAGGHLALWLAARPALPAASPLHRADPLPIAAVVSAGGLPDLETARSPPGDTCGREAVDALIGAPSPVRADVYRDTSPAAMMPFAARQVLINTTLDRIAPPAFAAAYAARAARAGVAVERVTVPDEGHVELIAPERAGWRAARDVVEAALARLPVSAAPRS